MFTSYSDRIEITSRGNLPPTQTKEGFFKGRSVPVNKKLSEIFVQLHISEKSGRGVPRIVKEYGKDAFDFSDNSIMVTIPFERIDSAEKSSRIPMSSSPIPLAEDTIPLAGSVIPLAEDTIPLAEKSDSSSSDTQKTGRIRSNDIEEVQNKILDFCSEAKGMREIADWLGYKDKKTVRKYIEPLLEMGRMARTIPDKPTSNYQKYITIEK
jgi:predicted HTH transcriptional regulator